MGFSYSDAVVDSGNTTTEGVSVVVSQKDENVRISHPKIFNCQSVRIGADGSTESFGSNRNVISWNGKAYIVGDDAIHYHYTRSDVGEKRYGGDLHKMMVAYALLNLHVREYTDLTLLTPPAVLTNKHSKLALERSFPAHSRLGFDSIKAGEQIPWSTTLRTVRFIPEAYAAHGVYLYDEGGAPFSEWTGLFGGKSLIIDIGSETIDVVYFSDGIYDKQMTRSTPMSFREGTLKHIVKKIEIWYTLNIGMPAFSLENTIIDMLRTGYVDDNYLLQDERGAKPIDMKNVMRGIVAEYARFIADEIIRKYLNSFRDVDHVFLTGGGANLVGDAIRSMSKSRKIAERMMSDIDPVMQNAIGAMRISLAEKRGTKIV